MTIELALRKYTDIANQNMCKNNQDRLQMKTIIASTIPLDDRKEFYESADMIDLLKFSKDKMEV